MEETKKGWKEILLDIAVKLCLSIIGTIPLVYPILIIGLLLLDGGYLKILRLACMLALPALVFGLVWFRSRRKFLKYYALGLLVLIVAVSINTAYIRYDESITINTTPNINIYEYAPFDPESKIALLDGESSLQLNGDMPIVDGAAAAFPLYSSFVNATYPHWARPNDGILEYNNTVRGYQLLAQRETDIFFGAYPSKEQISYAEEQGTEFVYTPIGLEAFVFFVHKDNPVDNLTTEQIKGIYSGEITNWNQVGGNNEPITAYQRNEGSGSQSMLIRFMDGTPIMEPKTETVNTLMDGIVEQVVHYRNKDSSIGFSFRYYMEGIIKNPDVKLLSIDGISPTVENIQNGSYPITASLYAVTWAGNEKENVALLLNWILSEEGQELVEKTGYVPIG